MTRFCDQGGMRGKATFETVGLRTFAPRGFEMTLLASRAARAHRPTRPVPSVIPLYRSPLRRLAWLFGFRG
jgi:hypothetical protein